MQVSTLGIDLAKNVFQLHGVDHTGRIVFRKKLKRAQLVPFINQLPPCLIGMEACSSSHHFARVFSQFGHQVKLMPPQYVKPYVKTNSLSLGGFTLGGIGTATFGAIILYAILRKRGKVSGEALQRVG